jgi:hypothetical protein
MAFFKNLIDTIKRAFQGEPEDEREEDGIAKQREILSSYQSATLPSVTPSPTIPKSNINDNNIDKHPVNYTKPVESKPIKPTVKQITEVSDIVEYQMQNTKLAHLDVLIDALNLSRRKFVVDRGVVTIPFDASGCDFDTKRQLSMAVATEYQILTDSLPSGIACTEASKRIFSSIKASREECFVCGSLFIAVSQDIDDEGYLVAEVTNTHNGNSVFFDIPAEITADGTVDVDYDLITTNLMISREKVS